MECRVPASGAASGNRRATDAVLWNWEPFLRLLQPHPRRGFSSCCEYIRAPVSVPQSIAVHPNHGRHRPEVDLAETSRGCCEPISWGHLRRKQVRECEENSSNAHHGRHGAKADHYRRGGACREPVTRCHLQCETRPVFLMFFVHQLTFVTCVDIPVLWGAKVSDFGKSERSAGFGVGPRSPVAGKLSTDALYELPSMFQPTPKSRSCSFGVGKR
jgi:hypothetical protein